MIKRLIASLCILVAVIGFADDQRIHSKYKRGVFTHIHGIDDTSRIDFQNAAYIGTKGDSLMFYDVVTGDTVALIQLMPGGSMFEPDSMRIIGDDSLRIYIDSLYTDLPLFGTITTTWVTETAEFWLWEDGGLIRTEGTASTDTLNKQWAYSWLEGDGSESSVSSRRVITYKLASDTTMNITVTESDGIYTSSFSVDLDSSANTQILFNDTTTIAGDPSLLWNKTNNHLGIGVKPTYPLDIVGTDSSNSLFQMRFGSNSTINTNKSGGFVTRHYDGVNEVSGLLFSNVSGINAMYWGGGVLNHYAVTDHWFYAAASHTTTTGTKIVTIDSDGLTVDNGYASIDGQVRLNKSASTYIDANATDVILTDANNTDVTVDSLQQSYHAMIVRKSAVALESYASKNDRFALDMGKGLTVDFVNSTEDSAIVLIDTTVAITHKQIIDSNFVKVDGSKIVDSLTVGDGTNNFIVGSDGTIELEGTARVTAYDWVDAGAISAAGASAATKTVNGNGFEIISFADNLDKYVQANVKVPADMDYSEPLYIGLGWSSPTTSQYAYVEVEYLITEIGENTDQSGTSSTVAIQSSGTADGLVQSQWTIAGGTIDADDVCIHIIIHRDGNSILDTLGDVFELHGMVISYTKNKL